MNNNSKNYYERIIENFGENFYLNSENFLRDYIDENFTEFKKILSNGNKQFDTSTTSILNTLTFITSYENGNITFEPKMYNDLQNKWNIYAYQFNRLANSTKLTQEQINKKLQPVITNQKVVQKRLDKKYSLIDGKRNVNPHYIKQLNAIEKELNLNTKNPSQEDIAKNSEIISTALSHSFELISTWKDFDIYQKGTILGEIVREYGFVFINNQQRLNDLSHEINVATNNIIRQATPEAEQSK